MILFNFTHIAQKAWNSGKDRYGVKTPISFQTDYVLCELFKYPKSNVVTGFQRIGRDPAAIFWSLYKQLDAKSFADLQAKELDEHRLLMGLAKFKNPRHIITTIDMLDVIYMFGTSFTANAFRENKIDDEVIDSAWSQIKNCERGCFTPMSTLKENICEREEMRMYLNPDMKSGLSMYIKAIESGIYPSQELHVGFQYRGKSATWNKGAEIKGAEIR